MKYLVTKHRPQLRSIYQDWARHNIVAHALNMLGIAAVVMTFLIGFDLLFFGADAAFYLPFRLGCVIGLFTLFFITRSVRFPPGDVRNLLLGGGTGIIGLSMWNSIYIYFFLYGPPAHHGVVVAAIYMNIYITQFFAQRFWRTQYILTALYLGAIVGIMWFFQSSV